jgi:hypothetical protein
MPLAAKLVFRPIQAAADYELYSEESSMLLSLLLLLLLLLRIGF